LVVWRASAPTAIVTYRDGRKCALSSWSFRYTRRVAPPSSQAGPFSSPVVIDPSQGIETKTAEDLEIHKGAFELTGGQRIAQRDVRELRFFGRPEQKMFVVERMEIDTRNNGTLRVSTREGTLLYGNRHAGIALVGRSSDAECPGDIVISLSSGWSPTLASAPLRVELR
jgi:hypothetical protein